MITHIEDEQNFDNSYASRRGKQNKHILMKSLKSSNDMTSTHELQQPLHKQCRICLDSEQTSDNPMISPCKCTGSVKYVHDKCYRKWIERQYTSKNKKDQQDIKENGITCQICNEKVFLNFSSKYSCVTYQRFKQKFIQNINLFLLFSVFLSLNFGCISYLGYYTAKNSASLGSSLPSMIMIIAAFLFLSFTGLITLYYYVTDYFIDKISRLQSFQLKRLNEPIAGSRFRVHPLQIQEVPE